MKTVLTFKAVAKMKEVYLLINKPMSVHCWSQNFAKFMYSTSIVTEALVLCCELKGKVQVHELGKIMKLAIKHTSALF